MFTQNRVVKIHPRIFSITTNGKQLYLPVIKGQRLLDLKYRDMFF